MSLQSKVRDDEKNVDGERHTWEGEGLHICSGVLEEGLVKGPCLVLVIE